MSTSTNKLLRNELAFKNFVFVQGSVNCLIRKKGMTFYLSLWLSRKLHLPKGSSKRHLSKWSEPFILMHSNQVYNEMKDKKIALN
jgi:hypothetical protein